TSRFRVVSWDMNLAFGGLGRGGVARAGGNFGGRGANPLKSRFLASSAFVAIRASARTEVGRAIYGSGAAATELDALRTHLASSDLIASATLDSEASSLTSKIDSLAAS
ncbi:MAG: hypothetical protein WEE03_03190, partial [Chloroflexota bacterium]